METKHIFANFNDNRIVIKGSVDWEQSTQHTRYEFIREKSDFGFIKLMEAGFENYNSKFAGDYTPVFWRNFAVAIAKADIDVKKNVKIGISIAENTLAVEGTDGDSFSIRSVKKDGDFVRIEEPYSRDFNSDLGFAVPVFSDNWLKYIAKIYYNISLDEDYYNDCVATDFTVLGY